MVFYLYGQSFMNRQSFFTFQIIVFTLVAAGISTIYLTQPVLPILEREFGVTPSQASYTVSAVILGIALANLPFGMLADRFPVHRLVLVGGAVVAISGFFCAATTTLASLVGARFVQGLFVPALTTCLAAYLSANLPVERLNIVMGSYVSATVAGGLGGRLLSGWVTPPLHWRYAFFIAALLVLVSSLAAVIWLPEGKLPKSSAKSPEGFLALLSHRELRRVYLVAFSGFFVFSSIFNYLPFYLHRPPFKASTHLITLLYLTYIVGVFTGPLSGRLSNRISNGGTMVLGSLVFALAIGLTWIKSFYIIGLALVLVCAGFFSIHSAAVGSLNRKLTTSRGRANSLYVLAYYLGGAIGITVFGKAYGWAGWHGVAILGLVVLTVPLITGFKEMRDQAPEASGKEKLSAGV
jgi:MFS transporter, YNFM family, putative membrane transport protein